MQYNDGVKRIMASPWFSSMVLGGIIMAVYAGAWSGDFQFDDSHSILHNPHLEGWRTFVGHLGHMVRPVLYGTFLVDRSFFGNAATGYHALNLFLHLGSGFLICGILSRAVPEDSHHVPFWTALLFLVHPIQTETITYISGRASGLMAFFYLLGLLLYIEGTASRDKTVTSRRSLLGAVLAFILALGTKETAMTFPVALLLWDLLIRRLDLRELRTTFVSRHLSFWLVLLAIATWAWWHPRYAALVQFSFDLRPFGANLLSEVHAGMYALWLFVAPWRQSFDHDLPQIHSLIQWPLPLELVVFGGLTIVAVATDRRIPLVTFGIAWYWLQLGPMMLISRNDLLSERNLYLASFGILLVGVMLVSHLIRVVIDGLPRPALLRAAVGGLTIVVVLALCVGTVQRNALYRDPLLLWSDAVEKAPQKARPHNNLGHTYAERGDWEQAIEHFRKAAQLDPDYVVAQENLRDAYLHHVGRQ